MITPQCSRDQKQLFHLLIQKATFRLGKIRYAVLEEVCETYEEMAFFYNMIQESDVVIDGEFPPRVKKALLDYGIKIS